MSRGTLSAGPFLAWAGTLDGDMPVIGEAAGLGHDALTRTVHRVRTTQQQKVTLDMVDRAFTAAGQPHMLAILYPQDVVTEDRWCPTCVELVTAGDDGQCPWCNTTVDEDRAERALAARPVCAKAQTSTVETPARRLAKELRAAGLSYSTIACRLGVARSTAHGYVNAGS
jgi:hypothetical protein